MVETIGFIGAGYINSRIATLAVNAGYHVIIANSRGPASLRDLILELGPRAKPATVEEVAQAAEIISVSLPYGAFTKIDASLLKDKIVIDTMNYYPARDADYPDIANRVKTMSQWVQEHFQYSKVVKAFNNLDAFHLLTGATKRTDRPRWALPIAGDFADAKEAVTKFMDKINYEAVDCGTLAESWRIEPETPVYVNPYASKRPEGMDDEEAFYWYKRENDAVVTREDVLRFAAEAKRDFPAGGIPQHLPAEWFAWQIFFNSN